MSKNSRSGAGASGTPAIPWASALEQRPRFRHTGLQHPLDQSVGCLVTDGQPLTQPAPLVVIGLVESEEAGKQSDSARYRTRTVRVSRRHAHLGSVLHILDYMRRPNLGRG